MVGVGLVDLNVTVFFKYVKCLLIALSIGFHVINLLHGWSSTPKMPCSMTILTLWEAASIWDCVYYCTCQFSLTDHPRPPPRMDWDRTSSFCFLSVLQKELQEKQTSVKLLTMLFLHTFKAHTHTRAIQMDLTCDLQLGFHGSSITLQALLPHQKDLQQTQIVKTSGVNMGLPLQGTKPSVPKLMAL